MNTTEQINALVLQYGLSETVKQEIVKIAEIAYNEGYTKSYEDNSGQYYEGCPND
jgi:hypothetical protein